MRSGLGSRERTVTLAADDVCTTRPTIRIDTPIAGFVLASVAETPATGPPYG
jgi:hypothetical protein